MRRTQKAVWKEPAFVKLELGDTRAGDAPNRDSLSSNNNTAFPAY